MLDYIINICILSQVKKMLKYVKFVSHFILGLNLGCFCFSF